MDDMTLFARSRRRLEEARDQAAEWLWDQRRLRLKKPNAAVRSTARRQLYLGHLVDRRGIEPAPAAHRRARQRIGELLARGDVERLERSLASYRGLLLGPFIAS